MGKSKDINNDKRKAIINLHLSGKKSSEISEQLEISSRSVNRMISKYKENSLEIKPRSGCPKKTSVRQDRMLVRESLKNRFKSAKELKNECSLECSIRTVQRRLTDNDIKCYKPVKKALITKRQAKIRLNWCRDHENWSISDWKKVF